MADADYGRPVGLHIFNEIKSGVTQLKMMVGEDASADRVGYGEIVWDDWPRGCNDPDADWFGFIGVALKMCDLTVQTPNWTLLGRTGDIKLNLDRALVALDNYNPTEEETGVESSKRFIFLKSCLIRDINGCLKLASLFNAYCVQLGIYFGERPTEKWQDCELSGHLKMYGITKEDAGKICAALGAIRPEHLAYVEAGDLVGPSIPAAARPALITAVQDYRKKHGITKDIDTRPTVRKDETTVTTAGAHLVEMRALVEAL
jgi:hypothetical protein